MTTTNIKGFITNAGKYNEGHLLGEWITFPINNDELNEVLERIGINEEYEEYFFTDWECDFDLEFSEYEAIEDVNEIAEQLENLDEHELEVVQACIEDGRDFDDAIDIVENGNYSIYYDCEDMEDVAIEVIEACGYLQNVPDTVARYFDYEAFGRDLDIEGYFYFINGNCIELLD